MKYRNISRILGLYLFSLAAAMLIPLAVSFYYEYFFDSALHPQRHTTMPFLWTILLTIILACFFSFMGSTSYGHLYRREGIVSVVIIWFMTPVIAAVPFLVDGTFTNPFYAYLEATSGFTTTGITAMQAKKFDPETGQEIPITHVIAGALETTYTYMGTINPIRDPVTGKILHEGIEAVGKGLLFWRGFTQWIGGLGIVALFVALLPALGVGGKALLQTEMTGPMKDSLTPRIKETAKGLWKIYVGLTLLQVALLLFTNSKMDLFDAVLISFSTISTGGQSNYNESIGHFNNASTEWVVIVFMILGSINFSLYFAAVRGKLNRLNDPELLLFLVFVILSCSFAAYQIFGADKYLLSGAQEGKFSLAEAIRHGSFQIISSMTSTGFVTVYFEYWPYIVQVLMLLLMYLGGMSGSTAGGMKTIRIYMVFRIIQFKVESLFRPETVRKFRIGNKDVDNDAALMVLSYVLILMAVSVVGVFLFVMDGIDPETAMSIVACCINNTGIGFRMAGPTESYAFLSNFGVVVSSFLMLVGRLEFLAVFAILVPAFWRKT